MQSPRPQLFPPEEAVRPSGLACRPVLIDVQKPSSPTFCLAAEGVRLTTCMSFHSCSNATILDTKLRMSNGKNGSRVGNTGACLHVAKKKMQLAQAEAALLAACRAAAAALRQKSRGASSSSCLPSQQRGPASMRPRDSLLASARHSQHGSLDAPPKQEALPAAALGRCEPKHI